jgi:subtilase family serine protease
MATLRSLPLYALASALLFAAVSPAQQASSAARIAGPIDDSQLVALKGNVNPEANAKNDRGRVSDSLPMAEMAMVLSRTPERQAAFDAFVQSQYDSGSPNYHHWLTPAQIGQLYGPAQSDVDKITGWLAAKGFSQTRVSADRMSISFSGTAGVVANVFHTEIHQLSVNGKPHIANMSDPQIPAALAPVVFGIKGLHNFLPHPLHRVGSKVQFNPDAHGWVRMQGSPVASLASGGAPVTAPAASRQKFSTKPGYYFSNGNFGVEEDLSPADFAKIYNLPSGWPNSDNGSGQTITIVGTSDIDLGDVANFRTAFGLPSGKTPVIAHGPDGDPGNCGGNPSDYACTDSDLDENSLDVEWSGGVAAGAQVVLVTDAYNNQTIPTNDPVFDGAQWVVDNAYVQGSAVYGSHIISVSYGECELESGTSSNVAYNNLWQTAAAGGIAVFVATGDSGSPSCDDGFDGLYGYPYEAQYGLSVSGLASSPYNTAVGGTDFSWCQPTWTSNGESINGCSSSNASNYWNASNGSAQGSAKGYVPETPWNDTCMNPINASFLYSYAASLDITGVSTPEEACNFVYADSLSIYFNSEGEDPMVAYYLDTVGGSGGSSNCVVNSTTGVASNGGPNGACNSTATTTGSGEGNLTLVNDGWPSPSWQSGSGVTGTSGFTQRAIPDISFFAGDGTLDSATLICVSNDGASCTNISQTDDGNPSDTGGAEEVGGTSVATPEMAGVMALINAQAGSPQGSPNKELYDLAGKQTYSECSAENLTSTSCYFQDIDQGTNSMGCVDETNTAEGGAAYAGGGEWEETQQYAGSVSPNCTIVNSGDTVGTLSGYSAATGYDQATGLGSLNIANVISGWTAETSTTGSATATVTITPAETSITAGQSLGVTVSVSGSSAKPTGSIELTANDYEGAQIYDATVNISSGSASFTVPANTFTTTGSVVITAGYSGDTTYAPNIANATVTITSTAAPTTFALASIPSPASIAAGATATATATASTTDGYAGTITLSCTLTGSPIGAINLPTCAPSAAIVLPGTPTATLSVYTTASTVESNGTTKPANSKSLAGIGGGAALALLVFLGIPSRRKGWRALLGMVVLLATLGSMAACGGGISSTTIPGTTAGTYTFTVTAQGNPAPSSNPASQNFTVTVN